MRQITQPPRILLVCHASAAVGLGHLSRMLALTASLRKIGLTEVRLLVFGEAGLSDELEAVQHRVVEQTQDFAEVVELELYDFSPNAVVLDLSPALLPAGLDGLLVHASSLGVRTIGVDGIRTYCRNLDLLWIPSFYVDPPTSAACGQKLGYGWDSYLIQKRLPSKAWGPGTNVLVLTGGSDVSGQGATLPRMLDRALPPDCELHWVRGPFAAHPVLPAPPRLTWVIHDAPEALDNLIVASSYALCVFGVSAFEVLQYGIPTVVFSPYGGKDRIELGALDAEDVCGVAANPADAVSYLGQLMGDPDTAARYSQACRRLLALNGADNLAGRIKAWTAN